MLRNVAPIDSSTPPYNLQHSLLFCARCGRPGPLSALANQGDLVQVCRTCYLLGCVRQQVEEQPLSHEESEIVRVALQELYVYLSNR